MEFLKAEVSENIEIRIIHCIYCDCEDTEDASLSKKNDKATGG